MKRKGHTGRKELNGEAVAGSMILYAILKFPEITKGLKINGVIIENPMIQSHPDLQGGVVSKSALKIMAWMSPKSPATGWPASFISSDRFSDDGFSHDPKAFRDLNLDHDYRKIQNWSVLNEIIMAGNYILKNYNSWPSRIPLSLNISSDDIYVDNQVNYEFFKKVQGRNFQNNVFCYDGAFHSLKKEVDIWSDKLILNYDKFINGKKICEGSSGYVMPDRTSSSSRSTQRTRVTQGDASSRNSCSSSFYQKKPQHCIERHETKWFTK